MKKRTLSHTSLAGLFILITSSICLGEQHALNLKTPVQCAQIPSLAEVSTGQAFYQDRYLSAKEAAKIGIPLVNVSAAVDYLVIVRDYKRVKPCTATDGQTQLLYGQVIRAVIEVLSVTGSVGINVASIAAEGTLNHRSQYFYLYKDGLANPNIDKIISEVSGKVFDVENYALYQGIMPRMIALMADSATTLSVNLVDVVYSETDPSIVNAPVTSYALAQIADGRTCVDAQKRFSNDLAKAAIVQSTYTTLTKLCNASSPSNDSKTYAKSVLGGLKIK